MGTDGHAAGLLLRRASTLHLQTGNLLSWGRLRKKCPSSHGEELRDCIQKTLNEWSSQISPDLVRELPDVLECTVAHAVEKINPDEREEMKVSGGIQKRENVLVPHGRAFMAQEEGCVYSNVFLESCMN